MRLLQHEHLVMSVRGEHLVLHMMEADRYSAVKKQALAHTVSADFRTGKSTTATLMRHIT